MVELAIGFIEKLLIHPAFSYLKEQVRRQSGLSSKLENLRDRLLDVEPLLMITEQKMASNRRLAELLRNLEDAVYDAEDLLDEFAHPDDDHHSQQVESGDVKRKQAILPRFQTSPFVIVRRVITGDKSTTKITDVTKKLDSIRENIESLLKLLNLGASHNQRVDGGPKAGTWRIQTSFVVEEMLGRDQEKQYIKSMLLSSSQDEGGSSSAGDVLSVLPIVGIGGVGKTTLARSVYNDDDVKEDFDLRIWICVSEDFDVLRLTKKILEAVKRETITNDSNLNLLQSELHHAVASKRFLLILDDVWNDQSLQTKWDLLRAPILENQIVAPTRNAEATGMRLGKKLGSKIIVTTRDAKVARIMRTTKHLPLNTLSDHVLLQLFMSCAFKGVNPDDYPPESKGTVKKIARKLGGLPLAAKTVGALLNSKLDTRLNKEHWSNILESEIWQLPMKEDGIMPALRVSYNYLPPHLKQCFAYCAIFPQDYVFDREYLVLHWLAHGYIHPNGGATRLEATGQEYFDDLSRRSFFLPSKRDNKYVMHDLIHDLAQSISEHQCFRIDYQKHKEFPKTVRHLSICTNNADDLRQLESFNGLKKLRTLVFFSDFMPEMIPKLERVRVLDLQGHPFETFKYTCHSYFPETIVSLKHLRYLNLTPISCSELPKQICNLRHLQVFYLRGDGERFPKDFSNLINLRHLMFASSAAAISMITGVHKLKDLQELQAFKVLDEDGHELSELKDMNQIQGSLTIENLDKVADKKEAEEAKLLQKENLKELKLIWPRGRHRDARNNYGRADEDVIEGLQPSPYLEILQIDSYIGRDYPNWIKKKMLPNLSDLELVRCKNWDILPPLGQLPNLKRLKLYDMGAIRIIGLEFYGSANFPSLESLEFNRMEALHEWRGVEDGRQLFPSLRRLVVKHCRALRALPVLPPKLEVLYLENVGLLSLQLSSPPSMAALKELHVENCQQLTTLEGFQGLVSLQKLEVRLCPRLGECRVEEDDVPLSVSELCIDDQRLLSAGFLRRSLGSVRALRLIYGTSLTHFSAEEKESLKRLRALRHLTIRYCDELQALPEELQSLSSLRKLEIIKCREIRSLPLKGLPLGLEDFKLEGCNRELYLRCLKGKGEDWPKIQHIPRRLISIL